MLCVLNICNSVLSTVIRWDHKAAKCDNYLRHVPLRLEQLVSHWTDFHEIWYFMIFEKFVDNDQVLTKS